MAEAIVRIDHYSRQVFVNDEERHLAPMEYRVMTILYAFRGYPVTFELLRQLLWDAYFAVNPGKYHVCYLRKKLKPANPIKTCLKRSAYVWKCEPHTGRIIGTAK